jgi:hypothetical protein
MQPDFERQVLEYAKPMKFLMLMTAMSDQLLLGYSPLTSKIQ